MNIATTILSLCFLILLISDILLILKFKKFKRNNHENSINDYFRKYRKFKIWIWVLSIGLAILFVITLGIAFVTTFKQI